MRHRQEMQLVPVVVVDQARGLLERPGLEIDLGLEPQREMLLAARHQRLLEEAAQRFPRMQPEEARPLG